MVRFRIEEIDGRPVIWPSDADLEALRAMAGDVLVLDHKGYRIQSTTDEAERQIKIGLEVMEQHQETLAALAKT